MEAAGADSRKEGSEKEPKTIKIRINRDNDGLLPGGNEQIFIGCVDEVNGAEAVEVDGYVPTRHEVMQLVKYWYLRHLENSWDFFLTGQTGSSEFRLNRFARRRIARADAAIGEEAVDAAVKEAREEFKARDNDDRLWEIFEHGTPEQWEEVRIEFLREIQERHWADALKEMKDLETKHPGDLFVSVLHDCPDEKGRPVLVFPNADSELVPLLEASGEFEIETDKSRIRALMVDRLLSMSGFIRIRRQGPDWLFDFAAATPGTSGWHFLESVRDQIKKLLSNAKGRECNRAGSATEQGGE